MQTNESGLVPVNKGGRPPHEPDEKTRAIVESAVAFGITQDDIATHLGIDDDTLRKHYRKELDGGVFKAHMKVGGVILDLALRSKEVSRGIILRRSPHGLEGDYHARECRQGRRPDRN